MGSVPDNTGASLRAILGDVLGLAHGDIVEIGHDAATVAAAVIDGLCTGGSELVTLVTGDECTDDDLAAVRAHVRAQHPALDVVVYPGGQPHWPLIIGVE